MKINNMEQWILNLIIGGIIGACGWGFHMEMRVSRIELSEQIIIAILKDKLKISDMTVQEEMQSASQTN